MPTVLITGASRGIGLEFARQYGAAGWRVIATCRAPARAEQLQALAHDASSFIVHALDVDDFGRIEALAATLAGEAIDVLINNAAVMSSHEGFGETDYDRWARILHTNLLAPMKMAEAFVEHVAESEHKVIAMITSRMANIPTARPDGLVSYRTSKAALNMLTKIVAGYIEGRGIIAVALSPGWAATDMGLGVLAYHDTAGRAVFPDKAPDELINPVESVRGLRRLIENLTPEQTGAALLYDGQPIP